MELFLLVRLLKAELRIVVVFGVVLGSREQPLLCEGVDHRCPVGPGYLASRFRQPPAPTTCSMHTSPVLSLYTSLPKALCLCKMDGADVSWARFIQRGLLFAFKSLSGWVGLSFWLGFLAGSIQTGPPFALCSCHASEFGACSCTKFAFSSSMCCFCTSVCVPIYIYIYVCIKNIYICEYIGNLYPCTQTNS